MFRSLALAAIATLALAAPAVCDTITNVDFTPDSPAVLDFGEHVDFTFDYDISQDSRIFGRPLFAGGLAVAYAAHPSPLYMTGTGSGSGFFTIVDIGQGVSFVDQVRFQIYSGDLSVLIDQFFVPVNFQFGAAAVPEPGSLMLLGVGLLGLAGLRRRLRRNADSV